MTTDVWYSKLIFRQVNNDTVVPTLESFDKKLGEADAYLQLLIEQTKVKIIQIWIFIIY